MDDQVFRGYSVFRHELPGFRYMQFFHRPAAGILWCPSVQHQGIGPVTQGFLHTAGNEIRRPHLYV